MLQHPFIVAFTSVVVSVVNQLFTIINTNAWLVSKEESKLMFE